jgi:FixJ family two-component response regulator
MDSHAPQEHCGAMTSRNEAIAAECSMVTVVDDDESVRESLPDLLKQFGFKVRAFSSAEDFLSSDCLERTECLLLDIHMPGMSGLDLQRELTIRGKKIPIVFITAQKEQGVWASALQHGAISVLLKPFSEMALLDAIKTALNVT